MRYVATRLRDITRLALRLLLFEIQVGPANPLPLMLTSPLKLHFAVTLFFNRFQKLSFVELEFPIVFRRYHFYVSTRHRFQYRMGGRWRPSPPPSPALNVIFRAWQE